MLPLNQEIMTIGSGERMADGFWRQFAPQKPTGRECPSTAADASMKSFYRISTTVDRGSTVYSKRFRRTSVPGSQISIGEGRLVSMTRFQSPSDPC